MCNFRNARYKLRIKKYKLAIVRKKIVYCEIETGNAEKRSLKM